MAPESGQTKQLVQDYELEVCTATDTNGGFALDYRIELAAPPERVFAALTSEIGRWWPHTWRADAQAVVLEPQLGGRFMELWDDAGAGVVYGHVEVYAPPHTLRIRGSVGMNLAVNVMWTITLEERNGTTMLREVARVSGETTERLKAGMRKGTEEEYGVHLRNWLAAGTALR